MVKVNSGKLEQQLARHLGSGFDRLVLENDRSESWIIRRQRRPETDTEVLVAEQPEGELFEVHPLEQLGQLVLRLSRAGFIKHSYVLNGQRRVSLDARYGRARVKEGPRSGAQGRPGPLDPEHCAPLLTTLGLMKASGAMPARGQKKYKQINDFIRVAKPLVESLAKNPARGARPLRIVDLACGNSYLSLALAWVSQERWGIDTELIALDARPELVEASRERAERLGLRHARFERGVIGDLALEAADLVMALHACDTASDDALVSAIEARAEALMIVPCCQNELFTQLARADSPSPELTTQSLYRRAFATVLTDSLRALALEACGYRVKVLEFTASLHTSRSLMIRARRAQRPSAEARARFVEACARHGVEPSITRALDPRGATSAGS